MDIASSGWLVGCMRCKAKGFEIQALGHACS
jgi:hypothetical protein